MKLKNRKAIKMELRVTELIKIGKPVVGQMLNACYWFYFDNILANFFIMIILTESPVLIN